MSINKKFIFVLYVVSALWAPAGCSRNVPPKDGLKDTEEIISYYDTAKKNVKSIAIYKNGKRDGRYQEFYERNHRLKCEVEYRNGNRDGRYQEFYEENQKLKLEVEYKDGLKEGPLRKYFPLKDTVSEEIFYENGERHGPYKKYYPNSQLSEDATFLDGKKEGPDKFYNGDGVLIAELSYKNDKQDGLTKTYDDKGILLREAYFKEGQLDGGSKFYENGILVLEKTYEKGMNTGFAWEYFPNGKRKKEIIMRDNKQEGITRTYNDKGDLLTEAHYKDGILDGLSRFYDRGCLISEKTYEDGVNNGFYREYYKSGVLRREVYVLNEKWDGPSRIYSEDGKLEESGYYRPDPSDGVSKLDGEFKTYDKNGVVIKETTWKRGKKNGLCKLLTGVTPSHEILREIYKNAKLKEDIGFKDDAPVWFKIYDEKGRVIEESRYLDEDREINKVYLFFDVDTKKRLRDPVLFQEKHLQHNLPDGLTALYRADGSMSLERNYRSGKLDGMTRIYYDGNGAGVHYEDIYKDGQKVSRKAFDEDGRQQFEQLY